MARRPPPDRDRSHHPPSIEANPHALGDEVAPSRARGGANPEAKTEAGPRPGPDACSAQDRFIGLWGEMGSAWGIPRTMAEVHALLYMSPVALNTDDVMARLRISRGNASMTLRTLVDWGLVFRVHARGDRKEYFRAEQDVWRLFTTIVRERKRREFEPLLEALEGCRAGSESASRANAPRARRIDPEDDGVAEHNRRLDEMLELVRTLNSLSDRLIGEGGPGLLKAARLIMKVS